MRYILILIFILAPLHFLGQTHDAEYNDSLFLKLVSNFKKKFSIEDSLGLQRKTEAREYLKELNEQLKTNIFTKAKIVNGFRYINSYNSSHVTFGILEFEFSNNNDADHAFATFTNKSFDGSWGIDQMFSCSKKIRSRLIFIYSPNVLNKEMESFMKSICNTQ